MPLDGLFVCILSVGIRSSVPPVGELETPYTGSVFSAETRAAETLSAVVGCSFYHPLSRCDQGIPHLLANVHS